MRITEIRKEAKEALSGKWEKGVCISLAYLAVVIFVFALLYSSTALSLIAYIAGCVISIPLSFGIMVAFLKLKRNEDITAFCFVGIAIENFARAWKVAGRVLLKMLIPVIIIIFASWLCLALIFLGATLVNTGFERYSSIVMLPIVVISIPTIIYYISVSLLYLPSMLVAYDNKEMTGLEVVNESAKLMKGNRWKAVLLDLSFIGWIILTVFTLGIGYLWLVPYMQVAHICFYEHLLEKRNKSDIENNGEAIKEM